MDLYVLDKNMESVAILDAYKSLIWTERYFGYGDFEVCLGIEDATRNYILPDYYLWMEGSEQVMIIEELEIESDAEEGDMLVVTGRSLESVLERRIVWGQTTLSGNLQTEIKRLLDENLINPVDEVRRVDNFIFEESDDPAVTALEINVQSTGDDLYTVISTVCEVNGLGFKVYLSGDNKFVFKLYFGKDRSYDQFENPYVIFSPKFENMLSADYVRSVKNLKTVTLVMGEEQGEDRRRLTVEASGGAGTGLDRRELYTDARDISSDTEEGQLSEEEYNALLTERGLEKLLENTVTETFEGQADATRMFRYGEDFFKGDIVQIVSGYGVESRSRVTEFVRSISPEGTEFYPTFVTINNKEATM